MELSLEMDGGMLMPTSLDRILKFISFDLNLSMQIYQSQSIEPFSQFHI